MTPFMPVVQSDVQKGNGGIQALHCVRVANCILRAQIKGTGTGMTSKCLKNSFQGTFLFQRLDQVCPSTTEKNS